ADTEDRCDRGQEPGGKRQSAGRPRRRDRARRQAEAVAIAEIEDSRDRGQETRRQSQSAGRGGSSPAQLILRPATAAGPNDDFGPSGTRTSTTVVYGGRPWRPPSNTPEPAHTNAHTPAPPTP